uniref:F-box domain-containing protein n=1 Tax=Solanum tuberosum TaxID=4113 RepID=M1DRD2_SOLTU
MESEASHLLEKRSKHTSSAPFSFSSFEDSNFKFVPPADLINEILLSVLVKSLVKFRCVSKSWFGFISISEFIEFHLSISANNKAFHRLVMGFDPPENNLKDCSFSSLLHDHVTRAITWIITTMLVDKLGMLLNGKLYWVITNKLFGFYNDWDILTTDLADGRWEKIENPFYGEETSYFTAFLGVLGNDLSMFYYCLTDHADLWAMKENGVKESWAKMFDIRYLGYCLFGLHFSMSNEGEILFKNGSIFMIYNPNDNSI